MSEGKYVIRSRRRLRKQSFWVVAVAANGEPLSHSEQLTSKAAAMANIEAQRLLADAPIEDKT